MTDEMLEALPRHFNTWAVGPSSRLPDGWRQGYAAFLPKKAPELKTHRSWRTINKTLVKAWGGQPIAFVAARAVGGFQRCASRPACSVNGSLIRWRSMADVEALRSLGCDQLGPWVRRKKRQGAGKPHVSSLSRHMGGHAGRQRPFALVDRTRATLTTASPPPSDGLAPLPSLPCSPPSLASPCPRARLLPSPCVGTEIPPAPPTRGDRALRLRAHIRRRQSRCTCGPRTLTRSTAPPPPGRRRRQAPRSYPRRPATWRPRVGDGAPGLARPGLCMHGCARVLYSLVCF